MVTQTSWAILLRRLHIYKANHPLKMLKMNLKEFKRTSTRASQAKSKIPTRKLLRSIESARVYQTLQRLEKRNTPNHTRWPLNTFHQIKKELITSHLSKDSPVSSSSSSRTEMRPCSTTLTVISRKPFHWAMIRSLSTWVINSSNSILCSLKKHLAQILHWDCLAREAWQAKERSHLMVNLLMTTRSISEAPLPTKRANFTRLLIIKEEVTKLISLRHLSMKIFFRLRYLFLSPGDSAKKLSLSSFTARERYPIYIVP